MHESKARRIKTVLQQRGWSLKAAGGENSKDQATQQKTTHPAVNCYQQNIRRWQDSRATCDDLMAGLAQM